MKKPYALCDVLVVLAKEPADFHIAQTQGWYRIPASSRIPVVLQKRETRFIAFTFRRPSRSSATPSGSTPKYAA